MRKLLVYILILTLLFTSFSTGKIALADTEDTYISGDITASEWQLSEIKYFDFVNPTKIATSKNHIAVIDEGKTSHVHVFDKDGKFILSSSFSDPRDVEIVGNYVFVLDYDESSDATILSAIEISTKTPFVTLEDVAIFDIASDNGALYILTGLFSKSVERYTVSGGALIKDSSFSIKGAFNSVASISANDTHVLGHIQSGNPTIVAYSKASKSTTSIPLGISGVLDYFYNGTNLYLLTAKGVFSGKLTADATFTSALEVSTRKSGSENIISPTSFAFDKNSSNSFFILDGKDALAVKKFSFSGEGASPAFSTIGSLSSDSGAFNTPTSIAFSGNKLYVADSQNNRIQIITQSGKVTSFETINEKKEAYVPLFVGADYFGNIYVASKTKVYKYSSSFSQISEHSEGSGRKFSNITSLYASSVSGEVYIIENNRLFSLGDASGEFEAVRSSLPDSAFDIDMRYEKMITGEGNSFSVFDLKTFERQKSFTLDVPSQSIVDIKTDFGGNIYLLTKGSGISHIYKYSIDKNTYVFKGKVSISNELEFADFHIDAASETIYLLPANQHRILIVDSTGFDRLAVETFSDIKIPLDIFKEGEDKSVTIGTVLEAGNRLIFPLNKRDSLYPKNYAVESMRKLKGNEKVIVTGYTKDEKYAYVIYNNSAGFMDVAAISTSDQFDDVPFEYAVALHENTYIYKYPMTSTLDLYPLYSFDTLPKGFEMRVVNRASDYYSFTGLYWYRVKYEKNGTEYEGYIPRYNIAENLNIYAPEFEFGQINSDVLVGQVDVFADLGKTPLGVKLIDKTKIKIFELTGDYYFIQEVTDEDSGVIGYVHKNNVTRDAQTKSTTIALILIGVLIVVVGVLIAVKLLIKKSRR